MRKKKIILVDFDRTLIDTDRIRSGLFKIVRRFDVSLRRAKKAYTAGGLKAMSGPQIVASLVSVQKDKEMARSLAEALYHPPHIYNFPGVETFLRRLSKKYTLVLFTHGHPRYQRLKFTQSGLKRFFKKIVITDSQEKEKNILRFYMRHDTRVLLIDDSKAVERAAKKVGMKIIRIKKTWKDQYYYQDLLKKIEKKH